VRKIALALVMIVLPASLANAQTYQIGRWPADLDQVPCSAWTRNPDGSWTQKETIVIIANGKHYSENFFNFGVEKDILDKHCAGS
jgi:hypothetical protein